MDVVYDVIVLDTGNKVAELLVEIVLLEMQCTYFFVAVEMNKELNILFSHILARNTSI